ncbi:hypothetical protein DPMN_056057 [Dreissena polymorpha]|uniref:Uncharacterized protein n=1 Tax=Dreissena polymorpha TaxID=45954 RepID=A0A9D4HUN6_DREPO|nr:hypothetical protein DPMN_056057 [Dreissena polymorpha]
MVTRQEQFLSKCACIVSVICLTYFWYILGPSSDYFLVNIVCFVFKTLVSVIVCIPALWISLWRPKELLEDFVELCIYYGWAYVSLNQHIITIERNGDPYFLKDTIRANIKLALMQIALVLFFKTDERHSRTFAKLSTTIGVLASVPELLWLSNVNYLLGQFVFLNCSFDWVCRTFDKFVGRTLHNYISSSIRPGFAIAEFITRFLVYLLLILGR